MPTELVFLIDLLLWLVPSPLKRGTGRPRVRIVSARAVTVWGAGDARREVVIRVVNKGSGTAEGCWPQFLGMRPGPYAAIPPQPFAWDTPELVWSTPERTEINIPAHDETNDFALAFTMKSESERGALDLNLALAPVRERAAWLMALAPGKYTVAINVSGDNFVCPTRKFVISIDDDGARTWQTLDARPRRLWSYLGDVASWARRKSGRR